jgi:hypothetical protein
MANSREASISGTEEQQCGRTYRFSDDTLNVVMKEFYGVKGMEVRVMCNSEDTLRRCGCGRR